MKHTAHSWIVTLKHHKLLAGIIGFFVLEALWIALSSSYPMAFDEDFHLGIIIIYAHHLSPFLAHQPPDADQYGAVFRDPSYLYQYVMSFPYRLISVFTHDQTIQVIILRLINIVLFSVSLPLYYQVVRAAGVSKRLATALLGLLVLVPVVPLMAAQINYDNLLMPLVAWTLLLAIRFAAELRRQHRVNMVVFGKLLVACLLASLVQYEFLPIFLAIAIYIGVLLYRKLHHQPRNWIALRHSYRLLASGVRLSLVVAILLSGMLFLQRYGVNTLSYKTPIPACNKVLSIQACQAYGPWSRNYTYAQEKGNASRSPLVFSADWFYGMWLRSFFAVAGPANNYQTRGPLIIPGITVIVLAGGGLMLFIVYAKRIFRRYNSSVLWFFVFVSSCYAASLWLDNYQSFLQTGQAVAVNGRYLVPLLLPIMVFFALAYSEALRGKPRLRWAAVSLSILCLAWGGGVFTYMIRSNDSWYWQNQAVLDVNHVAQKILDPIVPGSDRPVEFL